MALETVAGVAGRIRSFFGRRSEVVRFWFGQIVHPVAEVGPLMASFGVVSSGTGVSASKEITVPQGKRWFVYWAQGYSTVSGTQNIVVRKGSGLGNPSPAFETDVEVARGTGTVLAEMVLAYLEAGDSILYGNDGAGADTLLKVWRSEFDA